MYLVVSINVRRRNIRLQKINWIFFSSPPNLAGVCCPGEGPPPPPPPPQPGPTRGHSLAWLILSHTKLNKNKKIFNFFKISYNELTIVCVSCLINFRFSKLKLRLMFKLVEGFLHWLEASLDRSPPSGWGRHQAQPRKTKDNKTKHTFW